jgi:hypothetical protein
MQGLDRGPQTKSSRLPGCGVWNPYRRSVRSRRNGFFSSLLVPDTELQPEGPRHAGDAHRHGHDEQADDAGLFT